MLLAKTSNDPVLCWTIPLPRSNTSCTCTCAVHRAITDAVLYMQGHQGFPVLLGCRTQPFSRAQLQQCLLLLLTQPMLLLSPLPQHTCLLHSHRLSSQLQLWCRLSQLQPPVAPHARRPQIWALLQLLGLQLCSCQLLLRLQVCFDKRSMLSINISIVCMQQCL